VEEIRLGRTDMEERCPYELPIREIIAERTRWYQEVKKQYEEQAA
jgi:hypothetical protein